MENSKEINMEEVIVYLQRLEEGINKLIEISLRNELRPGKLEDHIQAAD